MINRTHAQPVVRQGPRLELARATTYAQPRPVSASDLVLMRRTDARHLDDPFAGARMLRDVWRGEGSAIGRKRVRTVMARKGLDARYRKPNTSQHAASCHPVYPYRLRHLTINRSNQVWAADITYIPMTRGFLYLCALMDWASRRVLAWRLSNTLTTDCCLDAVQEALASYGRPDIFNTDHGSQISMDGTGCWRDNVFVERLWRSVQYEEVYWRAYDGVSAAHQAWNGT